MRLLPVLAAVLSLLLAAPLAPAAPPDGKGNPDKEKPERPDREKPEKPDKPDRGKPGEDEPEEPEEPVARNAEHLATLPAPGGISANFKRDGDSTYMFVSALSGLYVYDVTNGEQPALVSTLPLPHFQNEDVSLAGDRLLISTDGLAGGVLFEIDISDPATPRPARAIKMAPLGEGHTATCIDSECRWVWVAGDQVWSGITVLDLDKPAQLDAGVVKGDNDLGAFGFGVAPATDVVVGKVAGHREFGLVVHDVHVDEANVAWAAGFDGTIGFDVSDYGADGTDPLNPPVVARTGDNAINDGDMFDGPLAGQLGYDPENNEDTVNDFIHHNALRPDAGDTILITEEDLYNRRTTTTPGGCETQGSFQTWRLEGDTLTPLDSWKTEFNDVLDGQDKDPWGGDIVPSGGMCSAHYFDERDGLVAIAWYEQGMRLLDVSDPTSITQVGYWLPAGGTPWAAYWSPTAEDVVYVIDNNRGVDVLRVSEGGEQVEAPLDALALDSGSSASSPDETFGWVCRIAK